MFENLVAIEDVKGRLKNLLLTSLLCHDMESRSHDLETLLFKDDSEACVCYGEKHMIL